MAYKFGLVLMAITALATAQAGPTVNLGSANLDKSMINLLLQPTNLATSDDPAVSAQCFAKYLPVLTQVSNNFSTEYQKCITTANTAITTLTNEADQEKAAFILSSNNVCSGFEECGNDSDLLAFFNCYAKTASQDVSVLYDISQNAATDASSYLNQLQQIQEIEAACTNETERVYVTDTALTYDLLNSCLQNGLPVVSSTAAAVTTVAAASSEATTVASTAAAGTTAVNVLDANFVALNTQCSDGTGTHTQTSADGSQTQSQTGPGCQSQSSGSGSSSSSQSNGGSQSQSQCSGADCDEMKPLPPLFNMPTMAAMPPMSFN